MARKTSATAEQLFGSLGLRIIGPLIAAMVIGIVGIATWWSGKIWDGVKEDAARIETVEKRQQSLEDRADHQIEMMRARIEALEKHTEKIQKRPPKLGAGSACQHR